MYICFFKKKQKKTVTCFPWEVYYLPPGRREIIKRIPCVCSCVVECVSRFYKGLYITLVVSPWPFQCFYDLIAYVLSFDAVISHLGP